MTLVSSIDNTQILEEYGSSFPQSAASTQRENSATYCRRQHLDEQQTGKAYLQVIVTVVVVFSFRGSRVHRLHWSQNGEEVADVVNLVPCMRDADVLPTPTDTNAPSRFLHTAKRHHVIQHLLDRESTASSAAPQRFLRARYRLHLRLSKLLVGALRWRMREKSASVSRRVDRSFDGVRFVWLSGGCGNRERLLNLRKPTRFPAPKDRSEPKA